jgi:neopullulanase
MTYPGAPCVYYGDELGLTGKHDPDNRQGMPWHQPERWNRSLLEYTRHLIGLRRRYAALRRGSYRALYAQDGLYVFVRELPGEHFLVALNVNRRPAKLTISIAETPQLRGEFRDVLNGLSAHADHQWFTGAELPARSGAVFMRQAE